MDLKLFAREIRKTGFVLENQIAGDLKRLNWTVISNKYYVDDSEETVREIDLVAYRSAKVQYFDVYTVLVISCKKSEDNAWALLSREINLNDPNSDWWPLHAWSNDKALSFQLSEIGKARRYHEQQAKAGVREALSIPTVDVFAFQEMDKTSGKPKNDKPLFTAITSLMKAQAYELSALPGRKKAPCVFQFNLISVVDTELVRLMFNGSRVECTSIDSEHYLARYIVRKRETFSRIRFITASAFPTALQDYGRLHDANCKWFNSECNTFYKGVVGDSERATVLDEEFKKAINAAVWPQLFHKFRRVIDLGLPSLEWTKSSNQLRLLVNVPKDVVDFMNKNPNIRGRVLNALKKVYRYEGGFHFDDDIPF